MKKLWNWIKTTWAKLVAWFKGLFSRKVKKAERPKYDLNTFRYDLDEVKYGLEASPLEARDSFGAQRYDVIASDSFEYAFGPKEDSWADLLAQ